MGTQKEYYERLLESNEKVIESLIPIFGENSEIVQERKQSSKFIKKLIEEEE